jgi:hypothetical protein
MLENIHGCTIIDFFRSTLEWRWLFSTNEDTDIKNASEEHNCPFLDTITKYLRPGNL